MNREKNRLKVLVVDDEQKQCTILQLLMRNEGYEVRTADSVDKAMEQMQREAADVVVTDLRMGAKSGMELLEGIKKRYERCKVIMLTGYGSIENAVEAMKKGAWFYFIKGQGPEKLLEELRRLQKAHRGNGQLSQETVLPVNGKYMLETKNVRCEDEPLQGHHGAGVRDIPGADTDIWEQDTEHRQGGGVRLLQQAAFGVCAGERGVCGIPGPGEGGDRG